MTVAGELAEAVLEQVKNEFDAQTGYQLVLD